MPAHLATLADGRGVLARPLRYSQLAPLHDAREGHHPCRYFTTMRMTKDNNKPFVIEVDDALAQAWFGELLGRGSDLQPLMRDIGEILTKSTQQRFRDGVGPDGIAWEPLADGSGRRPLLDTGRMRDEIFPTSGEDWVEISATARQAKWHQEGTDPYVILAKPGKALSWPGLPSRTNKAGKTVPGAVKKVNHPGLPARPFIGLSDDDREQIEKTAGAWVSLKAD